MNRVATAALEQDVQHHVNEEENDLLPRLEQLISEAIRTALGRRMQARKRELGATRAAPARTATRKRQASGARRVRKSAARRARKTTVRRKKARAQ